MSVNFHFTILRDQRILFEYVQVAGYGMKKIIPWQQFIINLVENSIYCRMIF